MALPVSHPIVRGGSIPPMKRRNLLETLKEYPLT